MLSCFPCGRSAHFVLEPRRAGASSSPDHRCSPSSKEKNYFNEMNKDPCSRIIQEVNTHDDLNMGSFDEDTKYVDFSSEEKSIDAVTMHSPLAKEEEPAHPSNNASIPRSNSYRVEENEELVENIFCIKEEKKENIIGSSPEDDFREDKELDTNELADKEKLPRMKVVSGPAMPVETSVINATQSLLDRFGDEKELLKKDTISEGGITCVMRTACDTDNHQTPEPDYDEINMSNEASSTLQDGEEKQGTIRHVAHEDYNEYYDKGVITSQSKLESKALFSYGISDQQRDFLFLCAGLVIQAVGFQLRSLIEVATALILLCYRAYIFACRFANTVSHAKQKLVKMDTWLFSYVAINSTKIALHKERWESMKPLIIQGAKKMGWGCLNAAYVLAMLGALLLTSFLFSYLAVKGGATQKPLHIKQELYFDYTKPHPMASLDLFSLDAYSRMSNATKGIKINPSAAVRYRCTILLTLPESDHNRKLGVFQVRSEVLSEKGEIMVKGSQPCMLVFKSSTLHYVRAMVMAIPVLAGLASEAQTLRLQLLEWHHDDVYYQNSDERSSRARVLQIVLVPRAGLAISTGLPQLYKARLLLDSLPVHAVGNLPTITTLLMWIVLSFLIFGCLSTFCMIYTHKIHHKS